LESWRNHFDIIKQERKLQFKETENTSASPLFYTCFLGILGTITYLIKVTKFDVNHVDEFPQTALHTRCFFDKSYFSNYILHYKGADMTIASTAGRTPLYAASINGHLDVVKLLLDKGADLTVANNHGWTPLNTASSDSHLEVVKLLLTEVLILLSLTMIDGLHYI
jgi:FOG: Ankyrin repeat